MNVLFVLYGDLSTNTANPVSLFAQELIKLGHDCAICFPEDNEEPFVLNNVNEIRAYSYRHVLDCPLGVFSNGKAADLIHACTPRESVRLFVAKYMLQLPTPLVTYLEDNELWISQHHIKTNDDQLLSLTKKELFESVPQGMSNPFFYKQFIGLSDVVILIQEKLNIEVPLGIPYHVLPWGVDLDFFSPRDALDANKKRFNIDSSTKVIVYHGGLNGFTAPAIRDLCEAVLLINKLGIKCKLIRTGVMPLFFIDELGPEANEVIIDLGIIDRNLLPEILALADLYVQPGRIDPFEDLRLPSKVPEFLAMGKPVLLPNVNIAHLFRNGKDAVILTEGTPAEIANKCIDVFKDRDLAKKLGIHSRLFAEQHFDIKKQTLALETVYKEAITVFNFDITKRVWEEVSANSMTAAFVLRNLLLNQLNIKTNQSHNEISLSFINNLEVRVDSMGARIDFLNKVLIDRKTELKAKDQQISSKDQQISSKDQQISGLINSINEIHNSFSWKLSKPVRLVGGVVRKFIRTTNLIRYLMKANGGLIKFAIKFIKISCKEGPLGLYRRLRYLNNASTNFPSQRFEIILTPNLPIRTPRYDINKEGLDPKAINYYGYIKAESGLGMACRGYITLLRGLGYKVSAINLPCGLSEVEFDVDEVPNDSALFSLIHMNADSMHYFFTKISESHIKGKINIGLWVTELSAYRPDWFNSFSPLHEIWVPSDFCKQAVSAISPIPVQTIPYLVKLNSDDQNQYPRSYFGLPDQGFIYAFMFDCSSYIARKNPFALVRAFKKLHQIHGSIYLALKLSNAHKDPITFNALTDLIEGNRNIIIVDQSLSERELSAFYDNIDCYVSPHRSEGFGLTMAEAMLAQLPVIATNYSGSTDFVRSEHAYPIKTGLSVIEENHGPYFKGYIWGEPDFDDLVKKMSLVYLNQEEAKQKGRLARKYVLENYSIEAVSRLLEMHLNELGSTK